MGLFDDEMTEVPVPYQDPDAPDQSKQYRWEHRIVSMILKHYGLTKVAPEIARIAKDAEGSSRLTFANFRSLFGTFPVWLVCRKVPYVFKDLNPADMVHRWTKTRLFKAFVTAEADSPEAFQQGSRLGLVFEWLHVFPTAIVSNDYHESEFSETVFKHTIRNVIPHQHMAIQSFDMFLKSLRWTP